MTAFVVDMGAHFEALHPSFSVSNRAFAEADSLQLVFDIHLFCCISPTVLVRTKSGWGGVGGGEVIFETISKNFVD
jgi:hypothetical protein